jgi:hypothetical protein
VSRKKQPKMHQSAYCTAWLLITADPETVWTGLKPETKTERRLITTLHRPPKTHSYRSGHDLLVMIWGFILIPMGIQKQN